jgi:hypothetical protein
VFVAFMLFVVKYGGALFQRITIPEILEDEWFKKWYKPAYSEEEQNVNLDDVDAVFNDSEVRQFKYNFSQSRCLVTVPVMDFSYRLFYCRHIVGLIECPCPSAQYSLRKLFCFLPMEL